MCLKGKFAEMSECYWDVLVSHREVVLYDTLNHYGNTLTDPTRLYLPVWMDLDDGTAA